jgi:hypothetical protein
MQKLLIRSGDAKCELSERQEFAWLSEELADHFSEHLRSKSVPIHYGRSPTCTYRVLLVLLGLPLRLDSYRTLGSSGLWLIVAATK